MYKQKEMTGNTPTDRISQILEAQRKYFRSGATLELSFRKEMLKIYLASFTVTSKT